MNAACRARGEADLLRRWEGGQATYYSRRDAPPEIAGFTIAPLRKPQQTTVHVSPPLTVCDLPPLTVHFFYHPSQFIFYHPSQFIFYHPSQFIFYHPSQFIFYRPSQFIFYHPSQFVVYHPSGDNDNSQARLQRMDLPVQHTSNEPANESSVVRNAFLWYSRVACGLTA